MREQLSARFPNRARRIVSLVRRRPRRHRFGLANTFISTARRSSKNARKKGRGYTFSRASVRKTIIGRARGELYIIFSLECARVRHAALIFLLRSAALTYNKYTRCGLIVSLRMTTRRARLSRPESRIVFFFFGQELAVYYWAFALFPLASTLDTAIIRVRI